MKKAPKKTKGTDVMPQYVPDYGRISVTENQIKDLPNWKPGEKYKFTVEAELTELSINEYGDPKDRDKMQGRFKITKVSNIK